MDLASPPSKHVNIDGLVLVSSTSNSPASISVPWLRCSEASAVGLAFGLALPLAFPFAPAFDLALAFPLGIGSGDSEHGLGLNSELACEGLTCKTLLATIASTLGGFPRSFEPCCVLQMGVV